MDKRRTTRTRPKRSEETILPVAQSTIIGKRGSNTSQASTATTIIHSVRLSPSRARASPTRIPGGGGGRSSPPVRRSSRPRSSASSATITITPAVPPSPIKELKEPIPSPKPQPQPRDAATRAVPNKTVPTTSSSTGLGANATTTTNTTAKSASNLAANAKKKAEPITTSTVHSSTYTTTTMRKTLEIHGGANGADVGGGGGSELSKLKQFVRRSVSIPLTSVLSRSREPSREPSQTPTTNTELETHSRYSRSTSRSLYGDDDRYSEAGAADKLNEIYEEEDEDELDAEDEQYKSFSYNTQHQPCLRPTTSSSAVLLCRKLAAPQEFGGRWGALLLLLATPLLVYYLQWCCNSNPKLAEKVCTLRRPNLLAAIDAKLLQRVFPLHAVGAYVAALLGVCTLSAVLPGKQVWLPLERGNISYKFNAPAMAVLLSIGLAVAQRWPEYAVVDFVLRHYTRFCIYGLMSAFVVALWAYVRSSDWMTHKLRAAAQSYAGDDLLLNEYGKTGNWLIDYAQGRQINPKWLGVVELKLVFYRFAWLSALLYAQCYLYRTVVWPAGLSATLTEAMAIPSPWECAYQVCLALQQHVARVQFDAAALLSAGMLLLYSGDALMFEHHLASSFELQGEGFGCLLLLRYAATPYLLSGVARYFHGQQPNGAVACQMAVYVPLLLLFAGLVVKRFSNAIKYQYRIKPLLPIFIGYNTVHTFQGRRLLLGGLWGRVRQPNYAGDIAALLALALPLAMRFVWSPLLGLLLLIAVLLHRTVRVNARNLARYHSSWVRYCAQVRNYILPKIY